MKLSDVETRGLFSVRAYIGVYFPEKSESDFSSKEEWDEYLDDIRRDEWLDLREPSTEEIRRMTARGIIPEGSLKGVDADTVIKIIGNESKSSKEQAREMESIFRSCIIGSSFTNDEGTEASSEDVWKLVVKRSAKLYTACMRVWVDSFSPLEKETRSS